jgi:short-subunit dehydrogenase
MQNLMKKYKGWALVTGASSGIGKEFAKELAKQNFNIVLVGRNKTALQSISTELQTKHAIDIQIINADLTKADELSQLPILTKNLDISLVILSAGIDEMGSFLSKDYNKLQNMLRLNIDSLTYLAHHFSSRMKDRVNTKKRRSGIVFISSLFAYQGIPNFSVYAATKAYVLTLGEALTSELAKENIDVLTLSPGLTATPFADGLKMNLSLLPMFPQSPNIVARVGLSQLGKKATVIPGFINKFYAWENRLIPRTWPVWLFGFLIGNAMKSYEKRNKSKKERNLNITLEN